MHLTKVHVENPLRAIPRLLAHFLLQNNLGGFPFILMFWRKVEKRTGPLQVAAVDPEDTSPYIIGTYSHVAGNAPEMVHPLGIDRGNPVSLTGR